MTRMTDNPNKGKKLAVLGGGPGGYPAAFLAADLGFDVTLIDKEPKPGGVCLYRGCIPSKTMLHVAKLISEAHEAEDWGITFGKPKIDVAKLASFSQRVIAKLTGGLGALAKQRKVTMIQGTGKFLDNSTLEVEKTDGSTARVTFDYCIIATGSQPTKIPGFPYDSDRVMTSTEALQLKDVPPELLVVGGGYIGLELGTVYAALGSTVTVVEALGTILAGADPDLIEPLNKRLGKSVCKEILLNTKVTAMSATKTKVKVSLLGSKGPEEREFDKVLIAVGRKPNSAGIGLENTKVKLTDRGFIAIDHQRRTNEPHIFAIGDVAGDPMLAHKATAEAKVAVEAMAGLPSGFDAQAIPAVVFTDPEVAWAGLTETQSRNQGLAHKVLRFPWAASGRATTLGRTDGLTKIIIDPHNDRVLGVGIVGVNAGELIAEGVLAVEMGARIQDVMSSIHAHPTLSETVMEAAEMSHGASAHYISRDPRKE